METIPLLIISGSVGSGKSTVLWEASDLLKESKIHHAALDLDALAQMYPPQGQHGVDLSFQNLAAVWPIYRTAGAERLLIARVVETRSELSRYAEAIPGAEITVCRLTAPVEQMQERLRVREPGMNQAWSLARAPELADILEKAEIEDLSIENGDDRSVTEVARQMLSSAGWL